MNWHELINAIHIISAGIWLGGLVFTTLVVSPAYKRMNWTPAERFAVRSEVGRQYTRVARVNLILLLLAALAGWSLRGWSTLAWVEIAFIALILFLAEMHAHVLAPRLGQAIRTGDEVARTRALRVTISVSMLNMLLSCVVAVLAI